MVMLAMAFEGFTVLGHFVDWVVGTPSKRAILFLTKS